MHTPTERTKKLWKPKEQRELEKLRANHEVFSDFSSLTALDLQLEDYGPMPDTEVTNSTVNTHRERPQTPSNKTSSVCSEKELTVDTRVVIEVQPGETGRLPSLHRKISKKNGDSGEDKISRKLSTDSLRNPRLPKVVVEGDDESPATLNTVKEEKADDPGDDIDGEASGENNDVLPCLSRGACTDDGGVYGKWSPFSVASVQNRVKSAGFVRIGGTRTDMYRKRDSKRKLMLREQHQNGADYIKPVMVNGSYPLESKRWSVGDGHKAQTPRESHVTPVCTRNIRPSSPKMCSQTSEVFIKPHRPTFITPSHPSSNYARNCDNWDSFPSIGTKTTRLQHKQTYLIDVGGRNVREKK
jgi:hypothetical protein